MTAQPYDPGPLPAAVEPASPEVSPAVMAAAKAAFREGLDTGEQGVLQRAISAALKAATVEVYAVLVEQGIDERTRQAEARLAKVTATAQAWATTGTADQRKAGRMLLSDLGH